MRSIELMDELIETVRAKTVRMCEGCRHWGGKPGWLAPAGWKRCKFDDQDTSPLHGCGKWERKGGVNGPKKIL